MWVEQQNRSIGVSVALSLAMTLLLLSLAGAALYANRDFVAQYFLPYEGDVELNEPRDERTAAHAQSFIDQEERIIDIVADANPAVVSIVVTKDVPVIERYFEEFSPFGEGFGTFRIPRQRQEGTEEREVGGGSGFFVSEDGLVVTNRHVVADPEASYTVLTNSGESFEAEVVARDSFMDIAVLQVTEGSDFDYLSFGNSDGLRLGQTVIAIGNALGEFRNSVSVGVVSGLSRSIIAGDMMGRSEQLEEVIQTDAAINPGNSGGPLLNSSGQVIGVNVATALGSENIGFALPSNVVADIVSSVKQYGEIVRPFLGVRYLTINEQIAEVNNLPVAYGALVVKGETMEELAVVPGSPADKAGIEENDIILEIAGISLEDRSLASIVREQGVGQTVEIKLLHDGEEKTVSATLEKAPE